MSEKQSCESQPMRVPIEVPRCAFEAFKAERGDRADAMVRLGFVKIVENEKDQNRACKP